MYRTLFAGLGCLVLLWACSEIDDSYSTNPNHRLGFSVDTLSFDTVFTTIGSATRQFMVYNTHAEPLNIEAVRLNQGSSGFRLNVDGRSGESFSNIRILGKDSLYVFVEVTVDPTGVNSPLLMEDRLDFTVNGRTQSVCLQAYGQDVHLYKGGYALKRDTLWTAERPYLIYDSLVVDSGITLTLEKGASLYMHAQAKWVINGTLKAAGTLDAPITFRGDRLDNLLTDLPYDRIANQWDGIYFGTGSFENLMDFVVVRNGNHGLQFLESAPEQPKIRISNSQITNMGEVVLNAVNCRIESVNTEFSNARGNILSLSGGNYHFIHCTLVNYYLLNPGRQGEPVLSLQTEKALKTVFDNCIIDGSFSEGDKPFKGELSIDDSKAEALSIRFNHCALKTMQLEDTAFVKTSFIHKDYPLRYKLLGKAETNAFDFRLDSCEAAVGKADPAIAARYPLDRWGIDRTTSSDGPDIGAYEYVPEPEKEDE
ncbi:MAG: hypothetical protein LBQ65_00795 [Tannerellaceae bacterium]|jgi:hypothetical protein|nr:hypothetical protein [Tannerellaceae bacterium]